MIRDRSSFSWFMMLLKNVNRSQRLGLHIAHSTKGLDGTSSDQTLRSGVVEQNDGSHKVFTYLIDKDDIHSLADQFTIAKGDKPFTILFVEGNDVVYAYYDNIEMRRVPMSSASEK
jgi:hypothetical protein